MELRRRLEWSLLLLLVLLEEIIDYRTSSSCSYLTAVIGSEKGRLRGEYGAVLVSYYVSW